MDRGITIYYYYYYYYYYYHYKDIIIMYLFITTIITIIIKYWYLVKLCQPVAGVASRQHLRSATRQLLVVLRQWLSSYG